MLCYFVIQTKTHWHFVVQNDWVISRVFQKTCGGKKIHISGMKRMDSEGNAMDISTMPPLIDSAKLEPELEPNHVHCFSTVAPHKNQEDFMTSFDDPIFPTSSNAFDSSFSRSQFPPIQGELEFSFNDFYSSSGFFSFEELWAESESGGQKNTHTHRNC